MYSKKERSLLPLAKINRKNSTDVERKLWYLLRNKLIGVKFRRQYQIANYIVDFICIEKSFIIECDGGQHNKDADKERDNYLTSRGYKILRFWNVDILKNPQAVIKMIINNVK
jgi:very-short-patch-repair endonuclease